MIEAYPLAWPEGWPRTLPQRRIAARFGKGERRYYQSNPSASYIDKRQLTVSDGTERILTELARMGIDRQDIVISTNVRTRLDGLPRSGEREPDDAGVAVYWTDPAIGNQPRCMAIDIYNRVADNLGAIAATMDAMRSIERHGGAQILKRAFAGFTALPAPGQTTARGWRDVLGFQSGDPTPELLRERYLSRRSAFHPDKGGTTDEFNAVQAAYEQAQQELRA